MLKLVTRAMAFAVVALALAACKEGGPGSARARAPIPPKTVALMQSKGMSPSAPILIRSYKKESELEIWKKNDKGEFALLKTYPICRWSGQLGPKVREGDRQAPEGFYTITPAQMNPNSNYYLSFDTGFPNAYDRAHGRTGKYLMVHGACSSAGCFSMTDEQIAEIYAIGREAFFGGQRSFQFQSYPFRMTPENLARYRNDPNIEFWKNLKEGSDYFEVTRQEPAVGVCNRRYVFGAQVNGCDVRNPPAVAEALAAKRASDEAKVAGLIAAGTRAVRLVYQDGGQHPSFRQASLFGGVSYDGPVSRPEAIAAGPKEIEVPDPPGAGPAAVAAARSAGQQGATTGAADPVATGSLAGARGAPAAETSAAAPAGTAGTAGGQENAAGAAPVISGAAPPQPAGLFSRVISGGGLGGVFGGADGAGGAEQRSGAAAAAPRASDG